MVEYSLEIIGFILPPPNTMNYIPASKYSLITSPFNKDRQALYKNINGSVANFYNYKQSKLMTLHFNFRYTRRQSPYIGPINFWIYNTTDNELHYLEFRLSSDEHRNVYHFYYHYNNNTQFEHLVSTGIGSPAINQNVTIDLLLNKDGYIDMYINGVKKFTYTNHKFRYIYYVSVESGYSPYNGEFDRDSDFIYDDIFCYFGNRILISQNYTPDYSKYFMWEEFYPHFIYDQNDNNKYGILS